MSRKYAPDSVDLAILKIVEDKRPENVDKLIALLREQVQISEVEAFNQIINLKERGKITLSTQPLPSSFKLSSYLKASQSYWYWITIVISLFTLVAVFAVSEGMWPWIYMRNVLGVIFVLYLPGYTFVKTLFITKPPFKASRKNLSRVEIIAFSFGCSITIVPLFGLFFNYVIGSVDFVLVFSSLIVFSMILATVALVREYHAKTSAQIL